jgi:hypothetical protein
MSLGRGFKDAIGMEEEGKGKGMGRGWEEVMSSKLERNGNELDDKRNETTMIFSIRSEKQNNYQRILIKGKSNLRVYNLADQQSIENPKRLPFFSFPQPTRSKWY